MSSMRARRVLVVLLGAGCACACERSEERVTRTTSTTTAPTSLPGVGSFGAPPPATTPTEVAAPPKLSERVHASWNPLLPEANSARIYGLARFKDQWWTGYSATKAGAVEMSLRPIVELLLDTGRRAPPMAQSLFGVVPSIDGEAPWLLYQTAIRRDLRPGRSVFAARAGSMRGEQVLGLDTGDTSTLHIDDMAWTPASPPRGIVLFREETHSAVGAPRTLGYFVSHDGKSSRRVIGSGPTSVATAAGPGGLVVAAYHAAPDGSASLSARWLDERGVERRRASQRLGKTEAFLSSEIGDVLLEWNGAVRIAGVSSAETDRVISIAGFDREGRSLELLRVSGRPGIRAEDVKLLECGRALWVVEHSTTGPRAHAFNALSLTDASPEPLLLWARELDTHARLGFEGVMTACFGPRAAFVARIDGTPPSLAFAEWSAGG